MDLKPLSYHQPRCKQVRESKVNSTERTGLPRAEHSDGHSALRATSENPPACCRVGEPPTSAAIVSLHDRLLAQPGWPLAQQPLNESVHGWITSNHLFNSRLWNEEDQARRKTVGDSAIAANKRAIDLYNQSRNDATERIDELLAVELGLVDPVSACSDTPKSTVPELAVLHSETAGSMIDRMSILALKIRAMRKQSERTDVGAAHRSGCFLRLQRLAQQRLDLATCFDRLLNEVRAGRMYFKIYRQFKMYNDPRFNPAIVSELQSCS